MGSPPSNPTAPENSPIEGIKRGVEGAVIKSYRLVGTFKTTGEGKHTTETPRCGFPALWDSEPKDARFRGEESTPVVCTGASRRIRIRDVMGGIPSRCLPERSLVTLCLFEILSTKTFLYFFTENATFR